MSASAGSFRAVVASNNWVNGNYSIDEVLKRGNWKSSNTFFRHYFQEVTIKPRINPNVLSKNFSTM